jgi:phosphoribosylformimino-5-aminoimidazole carboxamide ribotide isomerase
VRIIPAIDIFGGKCVRLAQGVFADRTEYSDDPRAMAEKFIRSGAKFLHVVDLEGAKENRLINWKSIEDILACDKLEIQVGGGIRSSDDIARLLKAGASRVVVGSIAVRSPETLQEWCREFGAGKFCVALDIKDGRVAYSGWMQSDEIDLHAVIERTAALGVKRFLSTDIRRDGLLAGPNVALYADLVQSFPGLEWLASGGVRSRDDVNALKSAGVFGAIIGKALYEGTLRLEELAQPSC